jgi:beta-glucosidase
LGCNIPLPSDLIDRAAQAAANCDIAIIFAGLNEEHESEGFDRKDLELPGNQNDLIKRVATVNPRTIVVFNNGSPINMNNWINYVPTVLECFYPGQECGNAITSVLFGEVNPSGKLPDTFPCRLEDTPTYFSYPEESGKVKYNEGIFVGYRWYDMKDIKPLFPFGHGLSYTNFAYSNLKIQPTQVKANEEITVSIDIKNAGEIEGKEVIQVYISDIESTVSRPPKELKVFQKIHLLPGEKKTVTFNLDKEAWSFYDPKKKDWVAEPGDFEVHVGSSSRDIRAKNIFTLIS